MSQDARQKGKICPTVPATTVTLQAKPALENRIGSFCVPMPPVTLFACGSTRLAISS